MIILSIPQQIAYLREMSNTVDTYIAKEIYKQDFNERDFSDKDILSQCYNILADELKDYGIKLVSDSYLKDFYLSNYIYYFAKFIKDLPNIVTTDTSDNLEAIIDNSNFILEDVITNFSNIPELSQIVYEFTYNDTFVNYCKSIVTSKTTDLSFAFDPHVSRQIQYLNKIRTLRELASKYSNLIINKLDLKVDNSVIAKLIKDYDSDKVTSDNLPIYSLVDSEDCPAEFKHFKEQKMLEHHLRSAHHIEYYLDPNKNPRPLLTVEALVLLVAHHVEINTTADEFTEAVANMINKAEPILLSSQKELIDTMVGVIVFHLINHGAE